MNFMDTVFLETDKREKIFTFILQKVKKWDFNIILEK